MFQNLFWQLSWWYRCHFATLEWHVRSLLGCWSGKSFITVYLAMRGWVAVKYEFYDFTTPDGTVIEDCPGPTTSCITHASKADAAVEARRWAIGEMVPYVPTSEPEVILRSKE